MRDQRARGHGENETVYTPSWHVDNMTAGKTFEYYRGYSASSIQMSFELIKELGMIELMKTHTPVREIHARGGVFY